MQEKLLGQSQWKDYSGPLGPPPLQHNYGYDGMESEEGKMGGLGGWQGQGSAVVEAFISFLTNIVSAATSFLS